ncbi:hypothetical protein OBBRIDRAFT_835812 [Obba rivulosa]|uniref:Uncharacterized protein n=1 Tax=Obba rivulosa TaxID=1052685 RepID=A0A8E2AS78_9APHY|nr:hypothetical protein OBBRIDRAFT_835812 [Obba rivulosa]
MCTLWGGFSRGDVGHRVAKLCSCRPRSSAPYLCFELRIPVRPPAVTSLCQGGIYSRKLEITAADDSRCVPPSHPEHNFASFMADSDCRSSLLAKFFQTQGADAELTPRALFKFVPALGACGFTNTSDQFAASVSSTTFHSFPGAGANANAYVA